AGGGGFDGLHKALSDGRAVAQQGAAHHGEIGGGELGSRQPRLLGRITEHAGGDGAGTQAEPQAFLPEAARGADEASGQEDGSWCANARENGPGMLEIVMPAIVKGEDAGGPGATGARCQVT